ncbi:MAG: hypothetical protein JXR70_11635 [Spirochaetales bacterium]|nr:hypothetical protein [Spirochaetales bacterium]
MKQLRFKLFSVFFLSVAYIAYELYVMRTFAIGNWSNFGTLVISTALLGVGLAGTLLTFVQKWVLKHLNSLFTYTAILFMPTMVLAHILSQQIPFRPLFIGADPMQILWIGAYYIVYSIPFFFSALFVGISFIALSSRVHRLYFWNMTGSGLGGFFVIACLYLFPPNVILVPLLVLTFISAVFGILRYNPSTQKVVFQVRELLTAVVMAVFSIILVLAAGQIKVSSFKDVSYIRKYPPDKVELVHHSYSPAGEYHVYKSSALHFLPGLSDEAANLEQLPQQLYWGLFVDGNGPMGIMGKLAPGEGAYLDYLPMTAPYEVLDKPNVLLVNMAGGISTRLALHHEPHKVTVVEPNPEMVHLLRDVPKIAEFNGHLFEDPRVKLIEGEPRAFCSTSREKFDLIDISLVDSIGISGRGGYAVHENFTYTVEAISDYFKALDDNGFLSITVWNGLAPPRNVIKIYSTVVEALNRMGLDPAKQIVSFDLLYSTATILVKKSAFTADEIHKLNRFISRMSFNKAYYPGMPRMNIDFDQMLMEYRVLFDQEIDNPYKDRKKLDLDPNTLYHLSLYTLLEGQGQTLFRNYIFDVSPMYDDRPYYSSYLRLDKLPMYLDQMQDVSEDWGLLILFGILIQSIIFGLIIILLPLIGRRKELFENKKGTAGVVVYFACLGMGYMFVEMFLIQRLSFFLADPIFSVSIVITSMLIISGLGSLLSHRLAEDRTKRVRIAVVGIIVSVLFYIFLLSPILNLLLGVPFGVKMLISVVLVAPSAFFLGIPFPTGLSAITEHKPKLLAWAWGMNGALSVTGTVVGTLCAVAFGFRFVLIAAALIYLVAGLIYKSNEA